MGARALPVDETTTLIRAGLEPREIKAIMWDRHRIDVTPEAISMFRARHGLEAVQPEHLDLLPWAIKVHGHRHKYVAQRLRSVSRQRAGKDMTESDLRLNSRWLAQLAENDAVVHYDGDTEQGWWYVPRRDGIDLDIIRNPYSTDEGGWENTEAQRKAGLRVVKDFTTLQAMSHSLDGLPGAAPAL
jgi:hypothetical protein